MTCAEMEARINALQQEYGKGEEELLRLKQRSKYLSAALQRITGGITVLQEQLQQEQQQARLPEPALEPVAAALPWETDHADR